MRTAQQNRNHTQKQRRRDTTAPILGHCQMKLHVFPTVCAWLKFRASRQTSPNIGELCLRGAWQQARCATAQRHAVHCTPNQQARLGIGLEIGHASILQIADVLRLSALRPLCCAVVPSTRLGWRLSASQWLSVRACCRSCLHPSYVVCAFAVFRCAQLTRCMPEEDLPRAPRPGWLVESNILSGRNVCKHANGLKPTCQ